MKVYIIPGSRADLHRIEGSYVYRQIDNKLVFKLEKPIPKRAEIIKCDNYWRIIDYEGSGANWLTRVTEAERLLPDNFKLEFIELESTELHRVAQNCIVVTDTRKAFFELYDELIDLVIEKFTVGSLFFYGLLSGLITEPTPLEANPGDYIRVAVTPESILVIKKERDPVTWPINYFGSKVAYARRLAALYPEGQSGVILDPMCGMARVPLQIAKEKGYRVKLNDANIAVYYIVKAILEGTEIDEESFKMTLESVKPYRGPFYKTQTKEVQRVTEKASMLIDGLVQHWKGNNSKTAIAWRGMLAAFMCSRVPYRLIRPSQPMNYDTTIGTLNYFRRAINELHKEFAGLGSITFKDIRELRFNPVSAAYLDPPYFDSRGKQKAHGYLAAYQHHANFLSAEHATYQDLERDECTELIKRVVSRSKFTVISINRDYLKVVLPELQRPGYSVESHLLAKRPTYVTGPGHFGYSTQRYGEYILIVKKRAPLVRIKKSIPDIEKAIPAIDKYPPENQVYNFVIQHHFRGKSVHADLRCEFEKLKTLIGWTINDQIEGIIKEPILSIQDARKVPPTAFKIIWSGPNKGEWLPRAKRGTKLPVTTSLRAHPKGLHPIDWLKIGNGIIRFARKKKKRSAAKGYPHVFLELDYGTVEYGTQKHWFHEYFFHGSVFNYRVVFRQFRFPLTKAQIRDIAESIGLELDDKGLDLVFLRLIESLPTDLIKAQRFIVLPPAEGEREYGRWGWLAIKPDVQVPYVLSKRAMEMRFVPPFGISALPKAIRAKIPREFHYWKEKSTKRRLKIRDDLIESDIVELEKAARTRFVLSRQIFKGPMHVRAGPSKVDYHLWIFQDNKPLVHFVLDQNPFESVATGIIEERGAKDWDAQGEIEPGTELNPTKETPSWIYQLDLGYVTVYIDEDDVKKWKFDGKKYRDTLLAEKEPESDLWKVSKETPFELVQSLLGGWEDGRPNRENDSES